MKLLYKKMEKKPKFSKIWFLETDHKLRDALGRMGLNACEIVDMLGVGQIRNSEETVTFWRLFL